MIRILDHTQVGRILARKAARFTAAERTVAPILEAVRRRGGKAVSEYARQFDGFDRPSLRIPESEPSSPA